MSAHSLDRIHPSELRAAQKLRRTVPAHLRRHRSYEGLGTGVVLVLALIGFFALASSTVRIIAGAILVALVALLITFGVWVLNNVR